MPDRRDASRRPPEQDPVAAHWIIRVAITLERVGVALLMAAALLAMGWGLIESPLAMWERT